ncbi:MAG: RHS repeat-associated core domain-containing protein [Bacteroidales bacterium]|nr:RHS repeat-associated core domain-containing protein [Bacteroidales bacterium]
MPRRTTHIVQTYNTATNACGRILRVDDGTGYQIFAYDHLGNVAENIRAIALPFEDSVYNFRMLFEYDSWNRVQRIVYPDSEVVTYNYDLGGNLNRVHTYKANHRDTLIKNILYDEFGHRTQVNFGNGVTTNYTYDILQRLSLLETKKPSSPALQKISYSFDLEDNITKVVNTAVGANGLGGAYTNEYNYDDLYRLTAANGSYSGNNTNYSLEMAYTPAGRLCSKLQDFTGTGNVYAYSQNNKQHAIRRIYNGITNELSNLRWDANGNLAQQTVYSVANNATTYQGMRYLQWDEDDRLNLVAGDGYLSYYAYGYDGNRAIKMTGNAAIDQTGTLLNSTNLENITIYPNEYLTVTQAEYTKYYYAGGNRIASKIGTGGFGKMTRLCTLDQGFSAGANTLLNFVLYQVTNTTQPPTDEYPVDVCGGYNVATELLTSQLPDFYISQTNLNFTQNNLLQQFRQNLTNSVEPVYYFHSDHLGSASWITNNTGLPVQHLQYLPFGEHFVNEHSSGYDERFTFTGKERDAETGYYYHGARFNSSDIGWLSVDPMADKYPSLTPYNYCAWNPIKLVDPEGEEVVIKTNSATYYWYKGSVYVDKKHTRKVNAGSTYMYNNNRMLYNINFRLNDIYDKREGKIVLNALCDSKQDYNISNDKGPTRNPSYSFEDNTIRLNGHSELSILSHELFHAFQDENNREPHTIYNEVEAYVFMGMITGDYSHSPFQSDKRDYQEAGERMIKGKFSTKDFNILLSRFRRDAKANQNGTYSNYKYNPGKYTPGQSLLKKFQR